MRVGVVNSILVHSLACRGGKGERREKGQEGKRGNESGTDTTTKEEACPDRGVSIWSTTMTAIKGEPICIGQHAYSRTSADRVLRNAVKYSSRGGSKEPT